MIDDIRIQSAASNYYNEHYDLSEFCNRANDVITISYRHGSGPVREIKFQPDDVYAQRIREVVKDATDERMAKCKQFDVDYRSRLVQQAITSLVEAMNSNR